MKVSYRPTLLLAAVVGIAVLFLLDHTYRTYEAQQSEHRLSKVASTLQNRFSVRLNRLIQVASDLSAFLLTQPNPPDSRSFAEFAAALRNHYPEIDALVYVGPDRVIREISPLVGNEHAVGLDLSKRPVAPLIEKAINERRLIVDPPHIMSNGQLAVIARIPMYHGDKFIGLAQTILRVPDIAQSVLGEFDNEFTLQLKDENGHVFWGKEQLEGPIQSRDVTYANGTWTLQIAHARPSGVNGFIVALIWGAGGLVLLVILRVLHSNYRLRLALKAEVAETTQELRLRNEALEQQILQRLEAEIQLRRSEQSLRDAQQIAHLGNWERDIVEDRLSWSDELYRIYGFKPREFEPTFEDFMLRIHPCDRESVLQALADALKYGTHFEPEHRIVLPDGSTRYVRVSGRFEYDEEGNPLRTVGTVQDITTQKLYLQALEESERKYRMVLEHANDGIVITNFEGKILDANRRFQSLLGYTHDELLRLHVSQLHPPEVAEEHRIAFARMRECGSSLTERLVVRRDGTTLPVEISGTVITFNNLPYIFGIFRDISDRKHIEAELEQYRNHLEQLVEQRTAELAELNSELEAFSYSVSHDLRAPLRVIKGFSVALCEDYGVQLDGPGREYLERIHSATERMGRLIDDLMRLSRTIHAEMHWENVSLSKIASELLHELSPADDDRNVRFAVADEITARGDPTLIRSLLQNLLNNAWKFTRRRADAVIEFGITSIEGETVYFVSDNGIGFDMSHAREIFKPFFRLHGVSDYEGSGIGLATVRRIIQHHGGRIWAESEPGQGATFYFTLGAGS